MFGPYLYFVEKIDGDYAHLRRIDPDSNEKDTTLVARALLPEDIFEGCHLLWENLQYTITDKSVI